MKLTKKQLLLLAVACFVLAALCAVLPFPWQGLKTIARVLALPLMIGAVLLAVNAMMVGADVDLLDAGFDEGPRPMPGRVPAAPVMPRSLPLEQRAGGSLRGAVSAMERMRPAFAQPPMVAWQFQRVLDGCKAVLAGVEAAGDACQAADFAVQYLPSAMQYLSACHREGCPDNAVETLARIAGACERQQDALAAEEYVTFEREYYALRADLEQAAFHWEL